VFVFVALVIFLAMFTPSKQGTKTAAAANTEKVEKTTVIHVGGIFLGFAVLLMFIAISTLAIGSIEGNRFSETRY